LNAAAIEPSQHPLNAAAIEAAMEGDDSSNRRSFTGKRKTGGGIGRHQKQRKVPAVTAEKEVASPSMRPHKEVAVAVASPSSRIKVLKATTLFESPLRHPAVGTMGMGDEEVPLKILH
jgi:hypothetical protein